MCIRDRSKIGVSSKLLIRLEVLEGARVHAILQFFWRLKEKMKEWKTNSITLPLVHASGVITLKRFVAFVSDSWIRPSVSSWMSQLPFIHLIETFMYSLREISLASSAIRENQRVLLISAKTCHSLTHHCYELIDDLWRDVLLFMKPCLHLRIILFL